jgi:hypothetical protein
MGILPRPCLLLLGCLLRDSEVAKAVRAYLIQAEQGISVEVFHRLLGDFAMALQKMEENRREMESLKQVHSREMESLKQTHSQEMEAMKQTHSREMGAMKDRIAKAEKEVAEVKGWLGSIENYLAEQENFYQFAEVRNIIAKLSGIQAKVSPQHQKEIKEKIKNSPNSRELGKNFKKQFGIKKYSELPEEKWQEAMEWLKSHEPSREPEAPPEW